MERTFKIRCEGTGTVTDVVEGLKLLMERVQLMDTHKLKRWEYAEGELHLEIKLFTPKPLPNEGK